MRKLSQECAARDEEISKVGEKYALVMKQNVNFETEIGEFQLFAIGIQNSQLEINQLAIALCQSACSGKNIKTFEVQWSLFLAVLSVCGPLLLHVSKKHPVPDSNRVFSYSYGSETCILFLA